ncbi:Yra2p KNAG_0G00120 [Huiozyma naganishii CBS 8797]|uniref:Uncharacterized protein n=1 Tax=Huiozyma naganishii (strain ATCC MYA-139 / BCRC 22969 / CBS 8797 / KCTC 17520 / NBRC 10181 / NCYC 3082 / Yp74L-3) TaxID=1071383 RepID=J7S8S5_HUIN7|nr:hypothetical protein KNAG_0G00120 [Kazachstania naganishii CBS 8797]CCK71071.1 hypothetical protein KNAG_0G00120 [Kazachstania naganishii CBS 8797]
MNWTPPPLYRVSQTIELPYVTCVNFVLHLFCLCANCSANACSLFINTFPFPELFTQNYRRREVRSNTLASRMNVPSRGPPVETKKRTKITLIPLDTSDFAIEDIVKEFGEPTYIHFYDSKDDRTCIFELSDLTSMESFVNKYNDYEIKEGSKIRAQIFEQPMKSTRPHQRGGQAYGSHYKVQQAERIPLRDNPRPVRRNERAKKPTLEELDAELDDYMNKDTSGTAEQSNSTNNTPEQSTGAPANT